MKLPELKYPRKEDLQDAPKGAWLARLLDAVNGNARSFEQVLGGNLSVEHQTPNRVAMKKLVHGVESFISNPFPGKRRCVGAWVVACDGGKRVLGTPIVRNVTIGGEAQIGVTVYYAPPHGRVDLRRNAAQTVANNSNTALQWTTQTAAIGDMSHSTSSSPDSITCAKAGVVLVTASIPFDTSTAGVRQGFLSPDNGATTYFHGPITPSGYTPILLNAQISVTAGQVLRAFVYQNSGGNLDVLSGSFLQARYVDVAPGTDANVTLYLFAE
jgi:hypothetical protein